MPWAVGPDGGGFIQFVAFGPKKPRNLPDGMVAIETDRTASELRECEIVDGQIAGKEASQIEAEEVTRAWDVLRAERTAKLVKTDWTQMQDAPVDQAAWAAYRQALRDLPENTNDPRSPDWPAKPGE
mgnify:CR=1 FL=1